MAARHVGRWRWQGGLAVSRRQDFLNATRASLQAMYPSRVVLRGLQDPAALGDDALRQGVFSIVAEQTDGWALHTSRESAYGDLSLVVLFDGLLANADTGTTADVEDLEAQAEQQLLDWAGAVKPEPLDAIYPAMAIYSRGIEAPYAWVLLKFKAKSV